MNVQKADDGEYPQTLLSSLSCGRGRMAAEQRKAGDQVGELSDHVRLESAISKGLQTGMDA